MLKENHFCPFTRAHCRLCGIYRARHYYANLSGRDKREGSTGQAFNELEEVFSLYLSCEGNEGYQYSTKLRVTDIESGETRIIPIEEARNWDFGDPEVIRTINGIQITSFNHLIQIIKLLDKKDEEYVDLVEARRFMLLAGG